VPRQLEAQPLYAAVGVANGHTGSELIVAGPIAKHLSVVPHGKSGLALGDRLGEEGMKCLRVYADEKGESHFSEMEIAMSESQLVPGHTIQRSSRTAAAHIHFLTFPAYLTTGIPRRHGNS